MRIGCLPYLNARPLIDWFEHHPLPDVQLHYAVPSQLIDALLKNELDLVLASTFPTLQHPELQLLPGLGITATGAVISVRLFSRVPIADIQTLAVDRSSRSSVALARIVLADRYGVTPKLLTLPPQLDDMLAQADAAMMIGNSCFSVSANHLIDLDLGEEWHHLTGLPFYFGGWIARSHEISKEATPLVETAFEYGFARVRELAIEEAKRIHQPFDLCHHYLTQVMRYRVGPEELAGLAEFRRRATHLHLL